MFEPFKEDIKDVKGRITKIEDWKTRQILPTLNQQDIMGNDSPLVLRDKGKKYLQESGGEEYLKKHFESDLLKQFDGLNKAYKIENKAIEVIQERYKLIDVELENIREYLYQQGLQSDGGIILLAIKLRDMVCEKNEIPIKKKEQQRVPK